jgi:hypothetical protein
VILEFGISCCRDKQVQDGITPRGSLLWTKSGGERLNGLVLFNLKNIEWSCVFLLVLISLMITN